MAKTGYHHGDLRAAMLAAAAEQIAADGIDAVSLRALARRAGVSHAAPAHHFGDRAGLLTALAAEGFGLLAAELEATSDARAAAVAYIRFALRYPGHFDVMFRRRLLRTEDAELVAARARSSAALRSSVVDGRTGAPSVDQQAVQLAAWSLVHGFASLWREGALETSPLASSTDPETAAQRMLDTVRFE
ncbi:TetR/AcrR family transcriptional regulator [Nocardia sienata]|uniref:TetR/AcrR family transcriptional regulator n=1 Tax=Nocardia sienata TaxID=248552 RepID=UPI0007A4780B|nr:TetR/AcrR family transcriptional regulator [Nocardia sienata]